MSELMIRRHVSSFVSEGQARAPRRRSSSDPEPVWDFVASSGEPVQVFDPSRRNGRGEIVWEVLAPGGMDAGPTTGTRSSSTRIGSAARNSWSEAAWSSSPAAW